MDTNELHPGDYHRRIGNLNATKLDTQYHSMRVNSCSLQTGVAGSQMGEHLTYTTVHDLVHTPAARTFWQTHSRKTSAGLLPRCNGRGYAGVAYSAVRGIDCCTCARVWGTRPPAERIQPQRIHDSLRDALQ